MRIKIFKAMNKKIFQNINLTCVFQNTNPFDTETSLSSVGEPVEPKPSALSQTVLCGMLSNTADGNVLFQETLPRRRDVRNSRLYQNDHLAVVRRKDGLYYPLLKAFKPEEMQDKASLAFKIYSELSEALNSID